MLIEFISNRLVESLRNFHSTQVAASTTHTCAITEEGFVFAWGSNKVH